jgi:DNA-binding NarL/FixJ family response regulator
VALATTKPTGILVAVSIRLYRDALVAALDREAAIDVVATCTCRDEMVRAVREHKPDVVLLDPALPGEGSLTWRFSGDGAALRLIVLAGPGTAATLLAGAQLGVSACVSGDDCVADLVRTIRRVAAGASASSPMLGEGRRSLRAKRLRDTPEGRLTARELEVVELIDEGLSNKEIARELSIELPTVKNHVHHVLEKLGASRRGQAAARLRQAGVLR